MRLRPGRSPCAPRRSTSTPPACSTPATSSGCTPCAWRRGACAPCWRSTSPVSRARPLRPVLTEVKELADALGERRDPDVELLALEQFAASVGPDERIGVELFIERTRAEQSDGNATLAAALERADASDLRTRLGALADLARGHEPEPEDAEDADEAEDAGEHPHGLGVVDGPEPAGVNQDTAW